jgi:sec-independent protein translocase protein TatC
MIEYTNFLIFLFLALMLVFQTPILVFTLIRSGLLSASYLRKERPKIYLGMVTAMAVVTPTPDALTLSLIALPVIGLFEGSVFLAQITKRGKRDEEEEEDKDESTHEHNSKPPSE